MKKINMILIAVAAFIILLAGCPAEPKYNTVNEQLMPFFKVEDGKIVVVKGANLSSLNVPDTVVDPSTGKSVTEFGGFEDENDKANLKEVNIADGVTSIGDNAFQNADKLTSMKFEDNSKHTNIGESAFEKTQIGSLSVPSSVDTIGGNAFKDTQIKDLSIPEGVSNIGSGAFDNAPVEKLEISTEHTSNLSDIFGEVRGEHDVFR